MKNIIKRTLSITLAFAVAFTFIPALSGGLDVHAAAKPAKVTMLKLVRSGQTVTLTWSKVKKNLNGYTIYRNGKAIKSVGKKVLTFKEKGLAPGTTYSYYVRAYRNVKQKQWYNKKTGKWQKSKPAKKYRGKSKKVTVRLYGKASPTHKCTTEGPKFKMTCGASSANGAIIVSWSVNTPASRYVVLRDGKEVARTTGLSFKDTKVAAGQSYTYTVQALSGNNEIIAKITLAPITAHAVVAASSFSIKGKRTTESITLEWTEFEGARGYKLQKNGASLIHLTGNQYTDTDNLSNEVAYTYLVTIVLEDGTEKVTKPITLKALTGSEPIEVQENSVIN